MMIVVIIIITRKLNNFTSFLCPKFLGSSA